MHRACSIVLSALAWSAPLWGETIRGTVRNDEGAAIAQARVRDIASGGVETTTGVDGTFALECALPCTLLVSHPRFAEQVVERRSGDEAPLAVVLVAKNAFYEEVIVSASRGGDPLAPRSVAATVIEVDDRAAAPASLTELVEGVAGVAENGQGGQFQVLSIRGISRWRVLTLISGMQMTSERRAGVSTSFLDPLLMGKVDVVRGPASTYYGSGALGGVLQVFPRSYTAPSVELGWDSHGDQRYAVAGWGDGDWSIGVGARSADDGEDALGNRLFDRFDQLSATVSRTWQRGDRDFELLVIPARGSDIAKPNTDFPERTTIYPEENHLLVKLGVADAGGWRFDAWVHPHDLTTETERVGDQSNVVDNETFDLGASFQRDWARGTLRGTWGLDYFGRRGVESRETETRFASGERTVIQALDGATQDEAAAYGSVRWRWGASSLQAGARYTFQRQDNAGFAASDDGAASGFVGLVRPLGGGVELVANLGTGLRFATLSERFFSGTTARGGVIGNPELGPERSLSADLGLRWYGTRSHLAGSVFQQEIDDYIERIEIADDLLTFVNLTSGTIAGVELEGFFQPDERWHFDWSAHLLDGEDDAGAPLADIPPDRLQVAVRFSQDPWQARLEYQYRSRKDDPGSGEVAIPDADVVSASLRYAVRPGLALTVRGSNLLDEAYFNSADDKASVARGRSIGLGLSWNRP